MDAHFEWVKNTYPIYKIDYLKNLYIYKKKIAGMKIFLPVAIPRASVITTWTILYDLPLTLPKSLIRKSSTGGNHPPESCVWREDF